MTVVLMEDPASGKVAIFDEASGGGAFDSINSARNAPLKTPALHLDKVYFHSDLDNMEVHSDTSVTISHAAVSGSSSGGIDAGSGPSDFGATGGASQNAANLRFKAASANWLLSTHGLGYPPNCLVIVGTSVLFPGMPVQTQSDGRGRYCSVYVTNTQVRLFEWSSVSGSNLAATSLTYRVIVFRNQRDPSGAILFDYNPVTGVVEMAKGRFRSDRRYLQVVPGGSNFGIAYGKTMDLKNGAPKFVNPNGAAFMPVPSGMGARMVVNYVDARTPKTYTPGFGASMAYNGSFTGPTQILVKAP
jgi:hypothetical protein